MTQDELVEALRKTSPEDEATLNTLIKRVVKESRALPRAATAHLSDPDSRLAQNASSVLNHIDDLATVPLLEAPEPRSAYDLTTRMSILVESQTEIRNTIAARLTRMLVDKRHVNYYVDPKLEEKPPQSRVCDEAYVLMRQLLNPSENEEEQSMNQRLFLRFPESKRDIEIQKLESKMNWPNFAAGEE